MSAPANSLFKIQKMRQRKLDHVMNRMRNAPSQQDGGYEYVDEQDSARVDLFSMATRVIKCETKGLFSFYHELPCA